MSLSLDNVVGVHAAALKLRGERHQVLSENIANADTPNYKARDIDFASALEQAQGAQQGLQLATTHEAHVAGANASSAGPDVLYRVPHSPSLDGNTVETQAEQAKFAENTVHYRASLDFLGGKFSSLVGALRGE